MLRCQRFTFEMVEEDRYTIKIAGEKVREENNHVIADKGNPTRWITNFKEHKYWRAST